MDIQDVQDFPTPSFKNGLPPRLVGFSTKMYFSLLQTKAYAAQLQQNSFQISHKASSSGIFFIPSFPALALPEVQLLRRDGIALGAQNCHWELDGAFTGEVSAVMCRELGCNIVEIGHAERRRLPFNESDEIIARKTLAVSSNQMVPLVCIGEKDKGESISQGVGNAIATCQSQIRPVLDKETSANIIFAYEPFWAIGGQEAASADYVLAVVGQLKVYIQNYLESKGRQQQTRILYGGSAGPGTWEQLKTGVDGLFLGRFAHNVDDFVNIVEEVTSS